MRQRYALVLSLALLGFACGNRDAAEKARIPVPVAATAGADTLAIERAVAGFLQGYATADVGTELLGEHITGPEMEDWVRWLEVQYRGVEERISADLEVRGIRALAIEGQAAGAGVEAVVTISAPGLNGQTVANPRRFQSPFILVRGDGPLDWRVVDAVRDGRSMQDSISVLENVQATGMGLRVEVASIYRFASGTVVNLRIANQTGKAVTVDGPHSVLQVGGRFLGSSQVTESLSAPIEPKTVAEGAINFPPVPLTSVPELLRLFVLEQDGEPAVVVELPTEAFPPTETQS